MSAPRTNIETQKRWHRAPIIGMAAVVIFALGLLFWQMVMVAEEGTPADSGADQIDGRTGETVPDATPIVPGDQPLIPGNDLPPLELPTPSPDVEIPPTSPIQTPPATPAP